jgi:hypothetical protein
MTRMPGGKKKGWNCSLCGSAHISPPEPHFDKPGPRPPPRRPTFPSQPPEMVIAEVPCALCDYRASSVSDASDHIWSAHVQQNAVCSFGGKPCASGTARRLAESGTSYKDHCDRVHDAFGYMCQLGAQCQLGAKCRSPRSHIVAMGVRNWLFAQKPPHSISDTPLLSMAMRPGESALIMLQARRRYRKVVAQQQVYDAPASSKLADPSDMSARLPNDMWLMVFEQLDMDSLFACTKVFSLFLSRVSPVEE